MVWHSIIGYFQHFDEYLTEGVYQHGCHLTGRCAASESSQKDKPQPVTSHTPTDAIPVTFGYPAVMWPVSRTAFH